MLKTQRTLTKMAFAIGAGAMHLHATPSRQSFVSGFSVLAVSSLRVCGVCSRGATPRNCVARWRWGGRWAAPLGGAPAHMQRGVSVAALLGVHVGGPARRMARLLCGCWLNLRRRVCVCAPRGSTHTCTPWFVAASVHVCDHAW